MQTIAFFKGILMFIILIVLVWKHDEILEMLNIRLSKILFLYVYIAIIFALNFLLF